MTTKKEITINITKDLVTTKDHLHNPSLGSSLDSIISPGRRKSSTSSKSSSKKIVGKNSEKLIKRPLAKNAGHSEEKDPKELSGGVALKDSRESPPGSRRMPARSISESNIKERGPSRITQQPSPELPQTRSDLHTKFSVPPPPPPPPQVLSKNKKTKSVTLNNEKLITSPNRVRNRSKRLKDVEEKQDHPEIEEKLEPKASGRTKPKPPPHNPTFNIKHANHDGSDEEKESKSARAEKSATKLTSISNNPHPKRAVKTSRDGSKKKLFHRHKEEVEDRAKRYVKAISSKTAKEPAPISPVKARKYPLMTIEKAVELGIPPLVFLNELQDLLTEEPEAPKKFLEVDGYQKLLSHLLSSDILVSKKILEILSDALQEKDTFVNLIIDSPETLTKITHLLIKHPNNNQIGILVYQFLCSLAEIPQSLGIDLDIQATLLCAINYYKSKSTEKRRFENMVENLRSGLVGKNLEEYEDTDNIYLPIIKLINSLIDDNELLEERIKLRNEFLLLGLDKIVDNLLGIDKIKESMLSDHLKAFKMSRESDNNKKLSSEMKVTMEQSESVQLLNEIMQHSQNSHIQNLLVNILQSLTKIPVHDKTGLPKWLLLDKIISDLCNQKNTITELINEGKINLEKGIEMEKLFLSSINEDKLTEELNTLKESYDLLVLSNEDLENRVMKKKEKIALIKAEHEEDIEEQRQQILEVDNYLEEYDQILEEYETNLLKTEEELQKTKNLLELKTIELTKYTEHFNGEVPRSKSFNETAKDDVTGIPKWKLQQQAMEKEIQERRERERAAKMLKVNTIRKRIKEMGHDAVDESNTIKGTPNSQLPIPAPDLPLPPPKPIGNLSRLKTNQTSSSPRTPTQKSLNISKLEEPKSPTHLSPHPQNPSFSPRTTTNPKEEELLLKLEKAKAKKKKFASQITKLEQEIGQQRMQILLLEKEKEARQRDEKRIQIKMQRVEEEKETVQRQRQTLQEDMKKLATQRDRITLDLKKEKQQVIKLKQELDTIRATYEEEKNVYLKDQEKLRKELEDKLEQITIERDLFETELMQEYMEEKDAAEKNLN